MNNLRERFTKWYYRKGYTVRYTNELIENNAYELIFCCPLWVRPLVYFFWSPSVYYHELSSDFIKDFGAEINLD